MIRRVIVMIVVLGTTGLLIVLWRQTPKDDRAGVLHHAELQEPKPAIEKRPPASAPTSIAASARSPHNNPREVGPTLPAEEKLIAKLMKDLDRITVADTSVLVAILNLSTNEDEIEYAAAGLARIGSSNAVSNLLTAYEAFAEPEFRANLAEIVASITNRDAVPAMIPVLNATHDDLLVRALGRVLASVADDQVVNDLVQTHSQSDDARIRLRLGIVLGSIHNPDATPALMAIAGTQTEPLSSSLAPFAVDALARVGTSEAADYLLHKLENAPLADQSTLIQAIGLLQGETALRTLQTAAATNANTVVRTAAIMALGNYSGDTVLTFLASLSRPDLSPEEMRAFELASSRIRSRTK